VKLCFWGGTQTVTGSIFFVVHENHNVLVDCGLFQGLKELRLKNWDKLPFPAEKIEAVILTHAHLDHSGYLPLLVKNGFTGRVFATAANRELCRILLLDSAYLQEEEAKFANRRGYSKHHPALPLYTRADAERAIELFADVPFDTPTAIGKGFRFEFKPAGHLLGAASLRLEGGGRSLIFSGDLGRTNDPIMKEPEVLLGADYLVVESTYGNRLHAQGDPMEEIQETVLRTLARGGTLIIPSFAVGRAQLILYYLKELRRQNRIPDIPIYLNSPMANSANIIFRKYTGLHRLSKDEAIAVCQVADVIATPEESKAINEDDQPKIIIAASGMASGGRVLHHLKAFGTNPRNTILFVGFQAVGTRGQSLVSGKKEVKIHGEMWPMRAEIVNIESLSAHADAGEIQTWVSLLSPKPKKVFVIHGEPSASRALADNLREHLGLEVSLPNLMSEIDL